MDQELKDVIEKAVKDAAEASAKVAVEEAKKASQAHVVMGESEEEKLSKGSAWKHAGLFYRDVALKAAGKRVELLERYEDATDKISKAVGGQSVTTSADGGVLVPTPMTTSLIKPDMEAEVVYPRALRVPMQTSTLKMPYLDSFTRSTYGRSNVTVALKGEGADLDTSVIKLNSFTMGCFKATAMCATTRELQEDSPISIEALINATVPEAFAWQRDAWFISGAGTTEPIGLLNAANAAMLTVNRNTGGTINATDVGAMYDKFHKPSLSRAVWLAGSDTGSAIHALTSFTSAAFSGRTDAPAGTLLGLPIIFSEFMAAKGTAGDLALVDLSKYMIGERSGLISDVSVHAYFTSDQTCYRFIQRLDGRWGLPAYYTLKNGCTVSPVVKLVNP